MKPMRRLFTLLLSTMLPAFALAQSPAVVPAQELIQPELVQASSPTQWWNSARAQGANDAHVLGALPLWSTPDGRILAIVASAGNRGAPVAPQSPQIGTAIDWRLVDVTSFVTAGLALKFPDGAAAYANFGRGIVLAPLLSSGSCAAGSSAASESCLLATLSNSGSANIGAEFSRGDVDLDVSYGLSWLHLNDAPGVALHAQPWDALNIGNGTPTLLLPGYSLANVQNAAVNAQSRWHLAGDEHIDLGAALSRIQYEIPGTPLLPTNLNQAALSFGVHGGEFSGQIVGRVLGQGDPLNSGQRWSSIDLGISWRAPWRGVFSVGAQNLWSSGSLPSLNDPSAHEVDPSQARVPYVQYHQDL